MNAIAPFKCLLACVTATTMCAMMTACSPSRTPSSDASSTAKRPASTVEVRRGGITPLSSSSTGVQVSKYSLACIAILFFQEGNRLLNTVPNQVSRLLQKIFFLSRQRQANWSSHPMTP